MQRIVGWLFMYFALGGVALEVFSATVDRPPDDIGPNERTWILTSKGDPALDPQIKPTTIVANGAEKVAARRVTQIATGMNFWDGEKWALSEPVFEMTETGFVATRLQYLVSIEKNLNQVNAVTIITRDGITLRSTPGCRCLI